VNCINLICAWQQMMRYKIFIANKKTQSHLINIFILKKRDSMIRIFESGVKYKRDEALKMREKYLLDLKSPEALNPDAKIPFISLKNLFLRPNIDSGKHKEKKNLNRKIH
jgi:hypothetical protein